MEAALVRKQVNEPPVEGEVADIVDADGNVVAPPPPPPLPDEPIVSETATEWIDFCGNCGGSDLRWWPTAPVPGNEALRRCRQCRASAVRKG